MIAFSGVAGVYALLTGILVLIGWWWNVDLLKRVFPGMISMNPITALGFMMGGISLWLQSGRKNGPFAMILAAAVALVGLWFCGCYLFGGDPVIDTSLFSTKLDDGEPVDINRMAPNTGAGMLLLGIGLLTMDRRPIRGIRLTELAAAFTGMIGLLALVGYFYQVDWLYGVKLHVPMAIHTAGSFMIIAVGLAFARPDDGMMKVVTGSGTGGVLARRLLPAVTILFVIAGALRILGERKDFYDTEAGVVVYTVLGIGIFGMFVMWTAKQMLQSDLERQRVEDDRERFFELSVDMLGVAGMDGYFTQINPSFSRTLGREPSEILSRPFMDFVHPDDVAATEREMEKLGQGEATLHFENRYLCGDGTWKWLQWSTRPYLEDGLLYAVARDVTRKKQDEENMQMINRELTEKTLMLEALNRELESFSYSVSHDLRAPLRGISGFSQALEEHCADALDPIAKGHLMRVRNAAARMGELIDDLLELSRLSRAELTAADVDLSVMAHELLGLYRQDEPARIVDTMIAPGIRVRGDAALLRVMLDNVLGNAWKFTSKNPRGRIEMDAVPRNGRLACTVRDNGVGFDMRYAHKLFGAFQRLHSQAEFKGTGIGLATVERIVHRHGGSVSATGVVGQGASIEFLLDAAGPCHET
jgi:PAS domain S-box-containing protein